MKHIILRSLLLLRPLLVIIFLIVHFQYSSMCSRSSTTVSYYFSSQLLSFLFRIYFSTIFFIISWKLLWLIKKGFLFLTYFLSLITSFINMGQKIDEENSFKIVAYWYMNYEPNEKAFIFKGGFYSSLSILFQTNYFELHCIWNICNSLFSMNRQRTANFYIFINFNSIIYIRKSILNLIKLRKR